MADYSQDKPSRAQGDPDPAGDASDFADLFNKFRRFVNDATNGQVAVWNAASSYAEAADQSGGGGGGDESASWLTTSQTLTSAGHYIVDSSGGTRTITLPDLATTGDGWVVTVKRYGANTVTVTCSGSDTFDTAKTSYVLAQDYSALKVAGIGTENRWFEFGYLGGLA